MKLEDIDSDNINEGYYSYRNSDAYKMDGGANDEGWGDNPMSKKQYHSSPRNYAIVINGKQWKIVKNINHARSIEKTLKSKGKDVEVKITDNPVTETTTAGAIAGSMGAGNGFANGGPGTLTRAQPIKKKKPKKEKKMRESELKEGLADLAQKAEHDHEVQMARADLYKLAKYSIKLHEMLKTVSEQEGLEGWQQAKITKAADYISSVYHNLDYDMKFGDGQDMGPEMAEGKSPHKKGSKKYNDQMKAKHAAMSEQEYKTTLQKKLDDSI